MQTDIFLSVGRTYNSNQEDFVCAIEDLLRANGMTPRTVGRNDFTSRQPLELIAEMMDRCKGTVVIAFERIRADHAIEFRGTTKEQSISDLALPTIWNQIEASMAYIKGHPLLVIVEDGLKTEGLLEGRYDWYVQRVDLDVDVLNGAEFKGIFSDWKRRVSEFEARGSEKQRIAPEQLTLGQLVRTIRLPQLWATIAALLVIAGIVATVAFNLGQAVAKH
ncbi:hypothetical protein AB0L00_12885 [Actinoallomurus sp. NPDC052308]|uniref:hypothetical protein n=1 Tax=Actinoallomurus sp. NPDC052308 TaxID=3155530 RepID=UPI00344A21C3